MLLINQYETDESTCCKHHCHSDKSYSRYVSLLNLYIRLQENGIKKSANMYHGVFSNSFIAIIIGELRAWMIKRGPILPQIYILLWLNSPILIQYITKELTWKIFKNRWPFTLIVNCLLHHLQRCCWGPAHLQTLLRQQWDAGIWTVLFMYLVAILWKLKEDYQKGML